MLLFFIKKMKIFYNILFSIILLILFYFAKGCQEDEVSKSINTCISIEKLLKDPTEVLDIDNINYLSKTIKSINKAGYEIDFIGLNNKNLQSKDFIKSKIYISKDCISLLKKNFDTGISQGMVMIVSNYNNTNTNGLPERYFVIRYSGSGSNKYINSTYYDFSICNKKPIFLNMSISIDDIKALRKKEKKNAYARDTYEQVDINIERVLYAKKKGIDLFDFNGDFFENICFKFTSENNTDVTLETRMTDYYQNVSLCDNKKNAYYQSFNYESENRTLYYSCVYGFYKDDDEKNSYLDKIDSKMNIVFTNSNFKVISCYKDILTINNIVKNYGEIICLFVIVMQLIFFMTFCCQGVDPLQKKVNDLLENPPKTSPIFKYLQQQKEGKDKININNIQINNQTNNNPLANNNNNANLNLNNNLNINQSDKNKNNNDQKDNNSFISEDLVSNFDLQSKNEVLPKNNIKPYNYVSNPPKNKKKRKSVIIERNDINLMIKNNEKELQENNTTMRRKSLVLQKNNQGIILQNIENGDVDEDKKTHLPERKLNEKEKKEAEKEAYEDKKENKIKEKVIRRRSSQLFDFDSHELNELSFIEAKMFDKRSFCEYYGFMITISNIIISLFRFEDFNISYIKLGLIFLLFPINLTFNALFFTSNDIKSVYINKISDISIDWKYLGRSFAPSIVSSIILIFFKLLALSHHSIRKIKQEETIEKARKKSECILSCVKFRISLYFIFSLILLILFGIFVGCFCSIFENTQLLLIKNMAFSWALSLLYPFLICIFTSIFRICSIHGRNERGYSGCFRINRILQMI